MAIVHLELTSEGKNAFHYAVKLCSRAALAGFNPLLVDFRRDNLCKHPDCEGRIDCFIASYSISGGEAEGAAALERLKQCVNEDNCWAGICLASSTHWSPPSARPSKPH